MKTSIKYFTVALVLVTFLSSFAANPKSEVVTIQTSAICESCKARIEKALKNTDGVLTANLNLNDKKIKVKFNPDKTSVDQIRNVIANTGYDADNVKKTPEAFNKLPRCCQKEGAPHEE